MSSNRVLLIGGTGTVGQPVAKQLQQDGFQVNILTRDVTSAQKRLGKGFEYIQGSIEDETSLMRGLKGCSGVHLSLPSGHQTAALERIQHQGTARVARLAAQQHIQHLTYVSGYLVSDQFAHIPAERAKLDAENVIRGSGVPYTIFRPTYFTDILPLFVQGKRASIFGTQPHPIRFITIGDFARMVSAAHRLPGTNRSLFVCGPQALTFEEALRIYVNQAAPQVQVSHAPFWMMQAVNRLFLRGQLTEILQLMAATEQVGEIGDPAEANQLFGPAKTTVLQWCTQMQGANLQA